MAALFVLSIMVRDLWDSCEKVVLSDKEVLLESVGY
jgi:hypothetical protein